MLKSLISSDLHTFVNFTQGPTQAIQSIFRLKYNELESTKFSLSLERIRQNSFFTISEYLTAILELVDRLCLCNNFSFSFGIQKKREIFFRGLANDAQLEMAKLNLTSADSIFAAIHKAETIVRTQVLSSSIFKPRGRSYHNSTHFQNRNLDYQSRPNNNHRYLNTNSQRPRKYVLSIENRDIVTRNVVAEDRILKTIKTLTLRTT